MIRLDRRAGEDLPTYMLRCLREATETRTSVCCAYDGRVFVLEPGMSGPTQRWRPTGRPAYG